MERLDRDRQAAGFKTDEGRPKYNYDIAYHLAEQIHTGVKAGRSVDAVLAENPDLEDQDIGVARLWAKWMSDGELADSMFKSAKTPLTE